MRIKKQDEEINDLMYGVQDKDDIWVSDDAQVVTTRFSEKEQRALYALEDIS